MNSFGHVYGMLLVDKIVKEDNKLITSKTGGGVPGSCGFHQAPRYGKEQLIPYNVSEAVINFLEVVKVNEENGEQQIFLSFPAVIKVSNTVQQEHPVGQIGEGVIKGLMQKIFFELFTFRDITYNMDYPGDIFFCIKTGGYPHLDEFVQLRLENLGNHIFAGHKAFAAGAFFWRLFLPVEILKTFGPIVARQIQ